MNNHNISTATQQQYASILEQIQQRAPRSLKARGDWLQCECPLPQHVGSSSFYVNKQGTWACCYSHCGNFNRKTFFEALSGQIIAPSSLVAKNDKKHTKNTQKSGKGDLKGVTLAQLAAAKGLDLQAVQALGWQDSVYPGTTIKAVRMPYYYQDGTLHGYRYRVNLTGNPKYLWQTGARVLPYGLPTVEDAAGVGHVVIVEGETDQVTLQFAGIPALGLPGVSTWQHQWGHYLNAGPGQPPIKVYVWVEPGKPGPDGLTPGMAMAKRVAESIGTVYLIHAPASAKDPNELSRICPTVDAFYGQILALMAAADEYRAERPTPAKNTVDTPDVRRTVIEYESKNPIPFDGHLDSSVSDTGTARNLWEESAGIFRYAQGIKPSLYSQGAYSPESQSGHISWHLGNTWRNPINAAFKRRVILSNVYGRHMFLAHQLYWRDISATNAHAPEVEAYHRQLRRYRDKAGQERFGPDWKHGDVAEQLENMPDAPGHIWIDCVERNGYVRIFSNYPAPSLEPIGQLESKLKLIEALKGIEAPDAENPDIGTWEDMADKHMRPYGGSQNWTVKIDTPNDEDKDRWVVVAEERHGKQIDMGDLAELCKQMQLPLPDTVKPYWRTQWQAGILIDGIGLEEFRDLLSLLGYTLRPMGGKNQD